MPCLSRLLLSAVALLATAVSAWPQSGRPAIKWEFKCRIDRKCGLQGSCSRQFTDFKIGVHPEGGVVLQRGIRPDERWAVFTPNAFAFQSPDAAQFFYLGRDSHFVWTRILPREPGAPSGARIPGNVAPQFVAEGAQVLAETGECAPWTL